MRQLSCDGCGAHEDYDAPKHRIKPVVFTVTDDPRFPSGTKKYEADLCPNCQELMLHTYFKVPAENRLELAAPTWTTDVEPEPQSLKAS